MLILFGVPAILLILAIFYLRKYQPDFLDVKAGDIFAPRFNQSRLERVKGYFNVFDAYEIDGQIIDVRKYLAVIPRGNCMEYAGIPEGTKAFALRINPDDLSGLVADESHLRFPSGLEVKKGDVILYHVPKEKSAAWEEKMRQVVAPEMRDGVQGIRSQKCEDGELKPSWHPVSELIGVVEYVAV